MNYQRVGIPGNQEDPCNSANRCPTTSVAFSAPTLTGLDPPTAAVLSSPTQAVAGSITTLVNAAPSLTVSGTPASAFRSAIAVPVDCFLRCIYILSLTFSYFLAP
ncbi:hypothetical protein Rs2_41877 [Raphanus sativus]|nr:hypothetical protein Rs2_41877 [Raphanus sativus]